MSLSGERGGEGAKQLKEGADYRGEIERALEIIEMTHASEYNPMNRYALIENSSKLLKKELDDRRAQLEDSIRSRLKLLYEARSDYHLLFQERDRLRLEERVLAEELPREELLKMSHKSLSAIRSDKHSELRGQKRGQLESNEQRLGKTKRSIEGLEESIGGLEEELRRVTQAERVYFQTTLRNGNDVRESGLVWVVKRLGVREQDMQHYDYPAYLDRRSRLFLVQKANSEQEEELLLEEKRRFVNEIGRTSSDPRLPLRAHPLGRELQPDRIVEGDFSSEAVPKKYRRSLKKITQLTEEFLKNSSLLELREKERRQAAEISADLEGLSNKEIYSQIGERIKRLDLSKMKKEKAGSKKLRLLEYQSLLEKIKNIHIKLEEMDLQHENHLLAHYRDNKHLYFAQAAACFGYKRAYSMIIKHFSWKNYHEPQ